MKRLLRQAVGFMGLSGIGWILDFCVYVAAGFFSGNPALNNTLSSWAGVTFVFLCARGRVFQNQGRLPFKWKYVIYLLYQAVLIFCVSRLLGGINGAISGCVEDEWIVRLSPVIAKILVTPVTMVMNFFVMKGVMEKI